MSDAATKTVGEALSQDSALKHATGKAIYIDDMPCRPNHCILRWAGPTESAGVS